MAAMFDNWATGNAYDEADAHSGWILGHFVSPDDDPRRTSALEVKWGIHSAGDRREDWLVGERRSTLLILVYGLFRLDLPDESVVLWRQGDYVLWHAGVDHSWQAEQDSVVITVRWPSLPEPPS